MKKLRWLALCWKRVRNRCICSDYVRNANWYVTHLVTVTITSRFCNKRQNTEEHIYATTAKQSHRNPLMQPGSQPSQAMEIFLWWWHYASCASNCVTHILRKEKYTLSCRNGVSRSPPNFRSGSRIFRKGGWNLFCREQFRVSVVRRSSSGIQGRNSYRRSGGLSLPEAGTLLWMQVNKPGCGSLLRGSLHK